MSFTQRLRALAILLLILAIPIVLADRLTQPPASDTALSPWAP